MDALLYDEEISLRYATQQREHDPKINRVLHSHNHVCELIFVFAGEGAYLVNGCSHPIYPGDFLLGNQGICTRSSPPRRWRSGPSALASGTAPARSSAGLSDAAGGWVRSSHGPQHDADGESVPAAL